MTQENVNQMDVLIVITSIIFNVIKVVVRPILINHQQHLINAKVYMIIAMLMKISRQYAVKQKIMIIIISTIILTNI